MHHQVTVDHHTYASCTIGISASQQQSKRSYSRSKAHQFTSTHRDFDVFDADRGTKLSIRRRGRPAAQERGGAVSNLSPSFSPRVKASEESSPWLRPCAPHSPMYVCQQPASISFCTKTGTATSRATGPISFSGTSRIMQHDSHSFGAGVKNVYFLRGE